MKVFSLNKLLELVAGAKEIIDKDENLHLMKCVRSEFPRLRDEIWVHSQLAFDESRDYVSALVWPVAALYGGNQPYIPRI